MMKRMSEKCPCCNQSLPPTPETVDEDTMVFIKGRAFRCEICDANVFRKAKNDPDLFVCNGCGTTYRGE